MARSILITGASSGIGATLALYYAQHEKSVTLFLGGRDAVRLEKIGEGCKKHGASVYTHVADVTDQAAMREWVISCHKEAALDLVIANAGISGGTGGFADGEPEKQVRGIFAINLDGVFNTIYPAMDCMKECGHGHVALMSSLASFCGWPGAPAYSASKGAVRMLGEGLHGPMLKAGINVSVICPGFIRTPLTDTNGYKMPFLMEVDRAAEIIAKGLEKKKLRIAFPWPTYFFAGLIGMMPSFLISRFLTKLPSKPGNPDQSSA